MALLGGTAGSHPASPVAWTESFPLCGLGAHHLPAPGREGAARQDTSPPGPRPHPGSPSHRESKAGAQEAEGGPRPEDRRRAGQSLHPAPPAQVGGLLGPGPASQLPQQRPAGKRLPGGPGGAGGQQDGVPSQPAGCSTVRHPLAVRSETGRGERPTQNSPGGRAAAPPAPSLPPAGRADAILKPPGCAPEARPPGTVNRWAEDRDAAPRPRACTEGPVSGLGPHSNSG